MRRAVFVLLAFACAACAARASASSIAYQKHIISSVPVHVVYVDLNDPDVKIAVAISKRGRGSSEPVGSMVSRTRPTAAITGTFFDTRSLLPTGDIVIGGIPAHSGSVGTALCIDFDNRASMVPHKLRQARTRAGYETVLGGGPTLVHDGRLALNPRAEGFSDRGVFRASRKTALALTRANKLLMVSVGRPVGLRRLAWIMLKLGAKDAILLDGGSSAAMYANGRFVLWPARRLTNLLVAYRSSNSYLQAAGQLAPTLIPAKRLREAVSSRYGHTEPWYERIARLSEATENSPFWTFAAHLTGMASFPSAN